MLDTVDKTKYLGVTIQSKHNWKPHIHNITKKANSVRAFLQRTLSNCPRPVKEQACKTYVRPILEYASTVWDPHTKELTSQLEMVQRRAARFVTADYRRRHSVTLLLNKPSFSAVPTVKSPCYIASITNVYPSQPVHLISYTPSLQTVATICSCNNTTAASTPTSTPSLASSTCGTNCHQTQFQNRLPSLTLR